MAFTAGRRFVDIVYPTRVSAEIGGKIHVYTKIAHGGSELFRIEFGSCRAFVARQLSDELYRVAFYEIVRNAGAFLLERDTRVGRSGEILRWENRVDLLKIGI